MSRTFDQILALELLVGEFDCTQSRCTTSREETRGHECPDVGTRGHQRFDFAEETKKAIGHGDRSRTSIAAPNNGRRPRDADRYGRFL
jgi:hypothetical protein